MEQELSVEESGFRYRARLNYIAGPGKQFGQPGKIVWKVIGSPDLAGVVDDIENDKNKVLGWIDFYAGAWTNVRREVQHADPARESGYRRYDLLETLRGQDIHLAGASLVATNPNEVMTAEDILSSGNLTSYLMDWLPRFRYHDRPRNNIGQQRSHDLGMIMQLLPLGNGYSPDKEPSGHTYQQRLESRLEQTSQRPLELPLATSLLQ